MTTTTTDRRRIRRAGGGEQPLALPPRRRMIARVLQDKRTQHPERAGAPMLEQLLAIAEREDIYIHFARIHASWNGMASGFPALPGAPGCIGISLRAGLSDRTRRVVLAHELAHCWLHIPDRRFMGARAREIRAHGRGGPLYQRCEDEADLLAAELLELPFEIVEAVVRTTRDTVANS